MLHDTEVMKIFWGRWNWLTQNGHISERMMHRTFCLWMPLMKGSEKAKLTLYMTERWRLCHKDRYRLQLRNRRTQSMCVMVASSQHTTTLLACLWRSVQLTAVLESLVMWKRHNYATQFQKWVLESRGCQRLWCNQAMSSTLQHAGPYYHRTEHRGMGRRLSSYSDAATGQFVQSIRGFYRPLDCLFIMLLT
jgi:hypothetical protein